MDFILLVKTHLTHLLVYHFWTWQSVKHQVLPDKWGLGLQELFFFFLRLWSSSLEFNSNWTQSRGTEFNQQGVRALCAATLQIKLKLVMDFAGTLHPALCRRSNKILKSLLTWFLRKKKPKKPTFLRLTIRVCFNKMFYEEADPSFNYLVWKYQQGFFLFCFL